MFNLVVARCSRLLLFLIESNRLKLVLAVFGMRPLPSASKYFVHFAATIAQQAIPLVAARSALRSEFVRPSSLVVREVAS